MALVFLQQKSCGGSSVIQKESTGKPGTGNPLLGTEPLLLNKLQERFFFFLSFLLQETTGCLEAGFFTMSV